jgi:hypothetical protein
MENQIVPVIDMAVLQEKANEAAMNGAIQVINEFYTGHKSPYKEALTQNMQGKGLDPSFELPDIVAVLNEKIATEIDTIANAAIAKTFFPLAKNFLTRTEENIKFSTILEKFIECMEYDAESDSEESYTVEHRDSSSSFFYKILSNGKEKYTLHFYQKKEYAELISLPNHSEKYVTQTMKIRIDGAGSLEMPFTKCILDDPFMTFCAKLVLGNTKIEMDVEDFEDSMFPQVEY